MEHILNFSIGIEDDKIIESVQRNAEKMIINDIKESILNTMFKRSYYGGKATELNRNGKIELKKDADFSGISEKIIKNTFMEYKDEIIERAAEKLCEYMKRTKKVKDAIDEVTG